MSKESITTHSISRKSSSSLDALSETESSELWISESSESTSSPEPRKEPGKAPKKSMNRSNLFKQNEYVTDSLSSGAEDYSKDLSPQCDSYTDFRIETTALSAENASDSTPESLKSLEPIPSFPVRHLLS